MEDLYKAVSNLAPKVVLLSGYILSAPWVFDGADADFVFRRGSEVVRLSPEKLGKAIVDNGIEVEVNGKPRFFVAVADNVENL